MVVGNLGPSFNEIFKSLWTFTVRNELGKHPMLPSTGPGHECSPELQASSLFKTQTGWQQVFFFGDEAEWSLLGLLPHRFVNVADKLLEWSFMQKRPALWGLLRAATTDRTQARDLYGRGYLPDSLVDRLRGLAGWRVEKEIGLEKGDNRNWPSKLHLNLIDIKVILWFLFVA